MTVSSIKILLNKIKNVELIGVYSALIIIIFYKTIF